MTGTPTTSRTRRPSTWVVVLVAALVLVTAWAAACTWAARSVVVTWAAPVDCEGTRSEATLEADAEIVLRPEMRCELTVSVRNPSWMPVAVDSVMAPFLGASGGPGVMLEGPNGGDVDAFLEVERRLGPGEVVDLVLVLVFREDGCTPDGGTMTLRDFPEVEVSALGWSRKVSAPQVVAFVGTTASSCDL